MSKRDRLQVMVDRQSNAPCLVNSLGVLFLFQNVDTVVNAKEACILERIVKIYQTTNFFLKIAIL